MCTVVGLFNSLNQIVHRHQSPQEARIEVVFLHINVIAPRLAEEEVAVEFTICVFRNSYGLTKTEICINNILSSLLDRKEQEKLQTG